MIDQIIPPPVNPNARKRAEGFTLVELLTVIAIVGVLATLLLTALGSAKKASWRARCISNLRQVTLALNMYLEDFEKRPAMLDPVVTSRYLPDSQVLLCPADRTRRWGNLVGGLPESTWDVAPPLIAAGIASAPDTPLAFTEPLPHSYLHPLSWDDESWDRLMRSGEAAGLAVCQLHGLGRPDPDLPTWRDFQGLILRAQRDGAVVTRRVFWTSSNQERTWTVAGGAEETFRADNSAPPPSALEPVTDERWTLFADEPFPKP